MVKDIIDNNKEIDINKSKINKLKELFPNCFSKNGEFDIAVFEKEMKENIDITKEGYSLEFLGKQYAKLIASIDTETILVPDEENNSKEENKNSENIYISGDNIDALKHLVKSYSDQIKCIYIDPPYNTGTDGFVYNDKFDFSKEKLMEKLDISEDEAERIYNMTNSKSNSHSAWLTFMYPRLYVARQLLAKEGVIFISIDDNEQANLKLLCDNIFGEENFIGVFCINSAPNARDYGHIGKMHDYALFYAKDIENTITNLIPETNKKFKYKDDKGGYNLHPLYNSNEAFTNQNRPNLYYPFYVNPNSEDENGFYNISSEKQDGWVEVFPPKSLKNKIQFVWRWGKDKAKENLNKEIVAYKVNNEYRIVQKMRHDAKLIRSFLYEKTYTNRNGTEEVEAIFNKKVFSFPKPVELIKLFLESGTDSKDSIVLDFFSGSATTAQAVMELNSKDAGNRKFIMVQLQEKCNIQSEGLKKEYKTIDEIGQERIRRAAKKIKEETKADIDYGFKHYTIQEIQTKTLDKLEKFEPNYIISDGDILNEFGKNSVLTTWMNEDGYGLKDEYETIDLKGYEAYKCENTIYLLNKNLPSESIKCLIEKYEEDKKFDCDRIVLFGYSFNLNEIQTLKDNLKQVKNIKDISVDVITRY